MVAPLIRCVALSPRAQRKLCSTRSVEVRKDLGGDYFLDRERPERLTRHLVRQLERLGQRVTLEPVAEGAR